ncbi:MAG TPA: hypothetical protein VEQ66_09095 [Propionibacteriaceae bacterium]|nr:hypothetical protein [Propionibacteriaceae bacterium]
MTTPAGEQADNPDELDQDSEPTMTAPVDDRPTGIEDDTLGETQGDVTSPDADDQSGAEAPASEG